MEDLLGLDRKVAADCMAIGHPLSDVRSYPAT